eukprot:COSAG04_NODE_9633_length_846_cov_0.888889_3_plen_126_part_01
MRVHRCSILTCLCLPVDESCPLQVHGAGVPQPQARPPRIRLRYLQRRIILWELWAKRRVYTGFRNLEENTVWDEETKQHRVDVKLVAKRMASGGQRPESPEDCPVLWSLLMQACWEAAIDARPTFP